MGPILEIWRYVHTGLQAYGLTNEPTLRKWHALNTEVSLGFTFYGSISCIQTPIPMTDIVIYAESFGVQVGMCNNTYFKVALCRNGDIDLDQIRSVAQAAEPMISDCQLDP